jgi:hypothetical protein
MKKIALSLALSLLALGASAATPQQEKMKSCNAEANHENLTGDARKEFMSKCLSASHEEKQLTPQQAKMRQCNHDADEQHLKGDARKQFMSGCLKKS